MKRRLNSVDPFEQYELLKENLLGIAQNLGKITKSMIPLLKQGGKYSCQSAKFMADKVCSAGEMLDKLENITNKITSSSSDISQLSNQISELKEKTEETKEELNKIASEEKTEETNQLGGSYLFFTNLGEEIPFIFNLSKSKQNKNKNKKNIKRK